MGSETEAACYCSNDDCTPDCLAHGDSPFEILSLYTSVSVGRRGPEEARSNFTLRGQGVYSVVTISLHRGSAGADGDAGLVCRGDRWFGIQHKGSLSFDG